MFLGQVINNYIEDENIKSTAKFASWLGNDETHYYRIWEVMDIEDLRALILLVIRWIETKELTRKYKNHMESKDNSSG